MAEVGAGGCRPSAVGGRYKSPCASAYVVARRVSSLRCAFVRVGGQSAKLNGWDEVMAVVVVAVLPKTKNEAEDA